MKLKMTFEVSESREFEHEELMEHMQGAMSEFFEDADIHCSFMTEETEQTVSK